MADEQATGAAAATNGVAAEAPVVERSSMTRQQQNDADRAAFLAASDEDEASAPEAETPAPVKRKTAKVEPVEEDDETEVADEEEDAEDIEDELDEDLDDLEDAEEDEDTEGKTDPAIAKGHAKIRKLETKMREGIARERAAQHAEIEKIVSDWKPRIAAAQEFEKIPKHDVIGILKAKGYTEDDLEDVSKILYGHSKTAAADPKNKAAVAQLQRERALREENAALRARQDAIEEKLAKRDEGDAIQKQTDAYMGKVVKSVSDATPILKEKLELAPNKTTNALKAIAHRLGQKAGALVDPKKVALAYEKAQRAAGVTVESVRALRKAPAVVATTAAAKSKTSAIKVVDKTATKAANGHSTPSRTEMIERLGKINRGELDPDLDD